jgi:hypothetical protein
MSPPRCPNCGSPATGPPLHGTPLVLCPACWTVVDPTAPPPTPPRPAVPWLLAEAPGPDETPRPVPPALALPRLPLDIPPPRAGWRLPPGLRLVLVVLVLSLVGGYALRFARVYYPSFREVTAPSGQFTLAFPDDPYWYNPIDTRERVELSGHVTRRYRNDRLEVYSIRVSRRPAAKLPRDPRADGMLALSRATELAKVSDPSFPGSARLGKWPGLASADYERPPGLADDGWWTAGRVVVDSERYYVLEVRGPEVRLGHWRVRRFFDSFRRWPG